MDSKQFKQILKGNSEWKILSIDPSISTVSELLNDEDSVVEVSNGRLDKMAGLLVLTNDRLVFGGVTPGSLLRKTRTEVLSLSQINSVTYSGSLLVGTLIVTTGGIKIEFTAMAPKTGKRLNDAIREKLASKPPAPPINVVVSTPPPPPATNMAEEIGRLGSLHQQGLLTDAEFAAAKAKILGI